MSGSAPKKKHFSMFSAVLAVICVVFVAEAAAPVAAIGNSQYFWWLFLMIAFLLPYGLIASELGTSFDEGGGLYDWVRNAFGGKWAGRTSWYYWINFPLWMASLAVIFPGMLSLIFGIEIGIVPALIIELAFIWIVTILAFYPVSDNIWILNGAAVIKVFLAVTVGVLGIYIAATKGLANELTFASLLPSFDLTSLSFISVIIFNFLGFEVICTFADDMEDPKKQIPKAIIIGGLAIAAIYIFSAFGINAAIPTAQISTSSGLIDAVGIMIGNPTGTFVLIVAALFLLTLFGNMVSWSLGVNNVAAQAAENGHMPKLFAHRDKKRNMPTGAAIMNGIVASFVVLIALIIPNEDLFWSFFALNLVMFLLSYIPVFPAFLKLRKEQPDTPRPFKAPGSPLMLKIMAIVPMSVLIISLIFVAIPLSFDSETLAATLPITIGSIIFIAIGEIMLIVKKVGRKEPTAGAGTSVIPTLEGTQSAEKGE